MHWSTMLNFPSSSGENRCLHLQGKKKTSIVNPGIPRLKSSNSSHNHHQLTSFDLNTTFSSDDEEKVVESFRHANAKIFFNNKKGGRRTRNFTALSSDFPSHRPSLTWDDFQKLEGNTWLNDSLINLWFWSFRQRELRLAQDGESERNYFFYTHFFQMLCAEDRYCYKTVKHHTNNVDIFAHNRLFFPVNVDNQHWFCVAIFMDEKKIVSFDSLGGNNMARLLCVFHFLVDEH